MYSEQGESVLISSADWLAERSEQARAHGDCARADQDRAPPRGVGAASLGRGELPIRLPALAS
jgi:hypothetical protein